jgi:hypothetical protein
MGRQIKRVPLDFDWPLKERWKGYLNPYYKHRRECPSCEGSGWNPETKRLSESWYGFIAGGDHWSNKLTQDEVDTLVEKGRLYELTHVWKSGKWQEREPPHYPTAAEVNAWSCDGLRHDAINQGICVEVRAKRLDVYGYCEVCDGEGELWDTPENKNLADEWEEEEPPQGDGWQLWENTTEGSPISPVFANQSEFIGYLIGQGYSRKAVENFVKDGWCWDALSVVKDDKRIVVSEVETAAYD